MTWSVHTADCLEFMRTLPDGSVDAVVTSPPYAMQRSKKYGGISESDYPEWTVCWMRDARRVLAPDGSVMVNIVEHKRGGTLSDYVHKTRLAVRSDGWYEVDELAWIKTNAPPGSWPFRRSWERVLWFSPVAKPKCDPLDRTRACKGKTAAKHFSMKFAGRTDCKGNSTPEHPRRPNWLMTNVGGGTGEHPAAFPVELAEWMMCPFSGTIYDPFAGSGTTGIACIQTGRNFIGTEIDPTYADIARRRCREAEEKVALLAGGVK